MGQGDEDEDEEAMRKAFEQFMLTGNKQVAPSGSGGGGGGGANDAATKGGGSGKKKKKKKRRGNRVDDVPTSSRPKASASHPSQSNDDEEKGDEGGETRTPATATRRTTKRTPSHDEAAVAAQKAAKRLHQLHGSFCAAIEREWFHIDDTLQEVMHSIVDIRRRLPSETKLLSRFDDHGVGSDADWRGHGFGPSEEPWHDLSSRNAYLTKDDVELALSHDVKQHEKMMAAMRTLLSDWSVCQESLERKLDELMRHGLRCGVRFEAAVVEEDGTAYVNGNIHGDAHAKLQSLSVKLTEEAGNVYRMLASELYRKQTLCQSVLRSVDDGLLVETTGSQQDTTVGIDGGGGGGGTERDESPLRIASKCCKAWPRGSKRSCVDAETISRILSASDRFQGGA